LRRLSHWIDIRELPPATLPKYLWMSVFAWILQGRAVKL